jgi:hypothetical protein
MGNLSSYHLSDFILFSETAYYRQFEFYNEAIWPLHVVAILFSLMIVCAPWKRSAWAGRGVAFILVVSWLWVAWAFLYQRFYQIHVVADWYALGFVFQAGLIIWYGVIKNCFDVGVSSRSRKSMATALLAFALFGYPFIAVISGRPWMQFEMFVLAPDPTVLATLAILLLYKAPGVLYVIPILWVLISAVTIYAM